MQFNCEMIKDPGVITLRMSGGLNEAAEIPAIVKGHKVVFDMDNLYHLNSGGVVVWIKWFKAHTTLSRIHLEKCRPQFVKGFNNVADFLSYNSQVDSFYVTYYCEAKDTRMDFLYKRGHHFDGQGKLNVFANVNHEGNSYEIDVDQQTYFHFLRR
jgi:hypothetical protein